MASSVFKFYAIFFIVDTFNIMLQGILAGAGKQSITSMWNVAMTFGWMIPGGYIFAFYLNFGLFGLWLSIAIFVSLLFIVNVFYFINLDYKKESNVIILILE